MGVDLEKVARGVRMILEGLGEDAEREGLRRTPERVAQMYAELTAGLWEEPAQEVTPLPGEDYNGLILVKDIDIASICEHHLAPFMGKCHIAYLPQEGRIVGLSKLARVVEILSHRLQVQERLTADIAATLEAGLKPCGVMVVIEAEHTCMTLRGVRKPGSLAVTSVTLGAFREHPTACAEALGLLGVGRVESKK